MELIAVRKKKEEEEKRREEMVSLAYVDQCDKYPLPPPLHLLPLTPPPPPFPPSPSPSVQERQKQLTLQRRKKRQDAQSSDTQADPMMTREGNDYEDKAELDDLIALLKSGEYFDRRRSRKLSGISVTSSGGTPRNSRVLEFSRDRKRSSQVGSNIIPETSDDNS